MEWDGYWRLLHLHRFHHNTPYNELRNHICCKKSVQGPEILCFYDCGYCTRVVTYIQCDNA